MKKLVLLLTLIVGFIACNSDDDSNPVSECDALYNSFQEKAANYLSNETISNCELAKTAGQAYIDEECLSGQELADFQQLVDEYDCSEPIIDCSNLASVTATAKSTYDGDNSNLNCIAYKEALQAQVDGNCLTGQDLTDTNLIIAGLDCEISICATLQQEASAIITDASTSGTINCAAAQQTLDNIVLNECSLEGVTVDQIKTAAAFLGCTLN